MNPSEQKAAEVLIDLALTEDVNTGDITTNYLISSEVRRKGRMVAKAEGVIAGLEVAEMVFRKLDDTFLWEVCRPDGSKVCKGDVIVEFEGSYRTILTGERTALNFLQRMSGIASITHTYVEAIKDYKTQILDTRKTLPGFRLLDKYAVRTGGGTNHRYGLYDMVMIKDNHIEVAGGIQQAVNAIRPHIDAEIKIEVETTNLKQVSEALQAKADIIMLDNMDTHTMAEAVKMIGDLAKVEASGNMNLSRLKEVAATGVDYISVGALTHSITALDISLQIK